MDIAMNSSSVYQVNINKLVAEISRVPYSTTASVRDDGNRGQADYIYML